MARLIFIFALVVICTGRPQGGRIFGGDEAVAGQFPFIVAINDESNAQLCGGTIIDRSWILTAAHCIDAMSLDSTVLAGTHIEHVGGKTYNIRALIRHENFSYLSLKDDIGLVHLDTPLIFDDNTQPIPIGPGPDNITCTVIGWGLTEDTDFPEAVRYVNGTTVSLKECQEAAVGHTDTIYLGVEQVCLLAGDQKGACYGDSGGPLMCDGKLVGVVSYTMDPCAKDLPDVYTRAEFYKDWIEENMKK